MSGPSIDLSKPNELIIFLIFISPIIVVTFITSLSIAHTNFKGFLYLGLLVLCVLLRSLSYDKDIQTDDLCTAINYGTSGNASLSVFIFAFTIMYLSYPMFSNGAPNLWVFTSMIVYLLLDLFIRMNHKCIVDTKDLFMNILLGMVSAGIIVTILYSSGNGKHLFFNEVSSNKEICYQPKEQTFKCQVYKDGTLVGDI